MMKTRNSGFELDVVAPEEDNDELVGDFPQKPLEKLPIDDLHCSVEIPIFVLL